VTLALLLSGILALGGDPPDPLPTADQFLDQDQDPVPPAEEPGFFEDVGNTIWSLGKTFVLDMGYLVTAPLRPTKEGFFIFVGGVALIVTTMEVLDEPIRGFAQRNRHEDLDNVLGIIQTGMSKPVATGVGMTSIGLLAGDPHLQRTGLEVVETDFVTALITGVGKRVFGRSRPFTERGSTSFKFMGGTEEGRRSFPSGGAQSAFAIAVPIAEEYPGTVLPYVAYTLASLAAIQRIVDDAHWTSDVLTSALLNVAVGKALVWLHQQTVQPPLVPWLASVDGERVLGLALERRF
jgi:membrane-associated phospholipid phosphatase